MKKDRIFNVFALLKTNYGKEFTIQEIKKTLALTQGETMGTLLFLQKNHLIKKQIKEEKSHYSISELGINFDIKQII